MKTVMIPRPLRKFLGTTLLLSYSLIMTILWCSAHKNSDTGVVTATQYPVQHQSISSRNRSVNKNDGMKHSRHGSSRSKQEQPTCMDWAALESADFATYVANLRASGCPEVTIRRIVTAEVKEAFDKDRLALLEKEPIPFWDATYGTGESQSIEFENLATEEKEFLFSLLGSDAVSQENEASGRMPSAWRFGPKLAGKSEAVTNILSHAETKREEILASLGDAEISSAHMEMLQQIEVEKVAALEATLTAEERDDFEMRNSEIANELREHLAAEGKRVNESQFREMFHARKNFASETEKAALSGADLSGAHANYQATVHNILQQLP